MRGATLRMVLAFKNLLFTVLIPGTVAVYVPWWLAQGRAPGPGWLRLVAVLVLGAGAAIYGWCVWDFARHGRGTPLPLDAPRTLVVRGLYRYSRNPMYVGVVTVILGWAAWHGAALLLLYALGVATCFHLFAVLYEEPHLTREFGDEYARYRARVPRWLPVPR